MRIPKNSCAVVSPRFRSEEHRSELQSHSDLVCRLRRPPSSTLLPYTTLFRSRCTPTRSWGPPAPGRGRCAASPGRRTRPGGNSRPASSARTGGCGTWRTACGSRRTAAPSSRPGSDRKSTGLNSSHTVISYAVYGDLRALHSFPTRRSSDLDVLRRGLGDRRPPGGVVALLHPGEERGQAVIVVLRPALERVVVALGALHADPEEQLRRRLAQVQIGRAQV